MEPDQASQFAEVYAQAEAEVRGRLKRQPHVHSQFRAGVQVAMRWLREALAARVGEDVISPRSIDDPRP